MNAEQVFQLPVVIESRDPNTGDQFRQRLVTLGKSLGGHSI